METSAWIHWQNRVPHFCAMEMSVQQGCGAGECIVGQQASLWNCSALLVGTALIQMCATVSWHNTVGRITSINISYLGKVPSSWHEIRLSPLGRTARGWYGDPSWGSDAGLTAWPWCSQAHQCWCEGDLHSIPCFTSWCLQSSACCVKQQKTRLSKTLLLYLHPELFVYHERCCEVILCQNKVFTHVFLSWQPHKAKAAVHFLQSNPRNSVAVWVSAVTQIWGCW